MPTLGNGSDKLKVVFAGTPEFAAHTLQAILDSQHEVIAVYTQPDRPAGRGKKLTASPVKQLALDNDLPVYQPLSLKAADDQQIFTELEADIMIVVAYGLILPKAILDVPKLGCLNVHASLLPRWRGAAPIQRAIAAGDATSGVTIMQMDEGLDTGNMLFKTQCDIGENETGEQLHDKLATLGANALIECLSLSVKGEKQDDELANYAHKLSKKEAVIQWQQPAQTIHNLVRAFNSWPVATTKINDKVCRVWQTQVLDTADLLETTTQYSNNQTPGTILSASKTGIDVATSDGTLRITQLQLQGGKVLSIEALLNSKKSLFEPGQQFLN